MAYFKPLKLIILFLFLSSLNGNFCLAQEEIEVTPTIIDEKVEARDILEFSVKIKNNKEKHVRFYPIVNDLSIEDGRQEFIDPMFLDKSVSLARWIEISRGRVELAPGEEIEIPFKISVNLSAKPGKRYASITFAEGSNKVDAEKNAKELNQPKVILNIEVIEHVVEKAQVNIFKAEKKIFFDFPIKFLLQIENIGNQEIKPIGSIYIYNRKGEEVGLVSLDEFLASIGPGNTDLFEGFWETNKGFGQYQAKLVAEYGQKGQRDLQDTINFWVFPWKFVIFFVGSLFILVFLLFSLLFRKSKPAQVYKIYSTRKTGKVINLKKR